jgi:DNA-binding GntR family transcriptional regulator
LVGQLLLGFKSPQNQNVLMEMQATMVANGRKSRRVQSSVNRIYDDLKAMVITYQFRPGERLNEVELAEQLGVSRTPLREVLNRLVAEGLLNFVPNHGFSSRPLDPKTIYNLYEARCGIETMNVKLAAARASDRDIQDLIAFWDQVRKKFSKCTPAELVQFDQQFHERLAELSGNTELYLILKNINSRLHFIRLVFMEKNARRAATRDEHKAILDALAQRDGEACVQLMQAHLDRLQSQLTDVIKEGIAQIYTKDAPELPDWFKPDSRS